MLFRSTRCYKLLYECGYRDGEQYRTQSHAFWNCLWLLHRGIASVERLHTRASVESIKAAFDRFEASGHAGARARRVVRQLTNDVWKTWRQARKVDPEHWTANNFFKSRFGNKAIERKAFHKLLPALRGLGRELVQSH